MKIILLTDIKGVGKKGDIISAADGYARNYLLPRNLGVAADKQNIEKLNSEKWKETKTKEEIISQARALAQKIEALDVIIYIRVGVGGKIFGSVTSKEIALAIAEHKLSIDKKKIILHEPIKSIGSTFVKVKLHPDVTANLKVTVKSDK